MSKYSKSKKMSHLMSLKNHQLVLVHSAGYLRIQNMGNGVFSVEKKSRWDFLSYTREISGDAKILEYIEAIEPDLRKWRVS